MNANKPANTTHEPIGGQAGASTCCSTAEQTVCCQASEQADCCAAETERQALGRPVCGCR